MHVWRPVFSGGGFIGLSLTLVLWAGAVRLALMLPGPVSAQTFWLAVGVLALFCLGAFFLYESLAFFSLRYTFDRNGLTIRWAGNSQVIPMNHITTIRRWEEGEEIRERGLRWPGFHRGVARSRMLGKIFFFARAGRKAQLVVHTAQASYVISPRRPEEFIKEMEIRRNLGINRPLAQELTYWWLFSWSPWRDRAFMLVGAIALLLNLALFALLCHRYTSLPPLIPTHFSEILEGGQGRIVADIIGQKEELFKIPLFGLILMAGDWGLGILLHRRRRLLAVLLGATAAAVQVVFGLATLYILYHR